MSNDLLFSVIPRRGTVPVKSDRGEVKKVAKKTPTHSSPDDENLPIIKEKQQQREQQEQSAGRDYSDEHVGLIVDTTDESGTLENSLQQTDSEASHQLTDEDSEADSDDKGTHLDITV